MTRAVAYLRVSTDDQSSKGMSLEAQRSKIEAYAALYDLGVVEFVVDAGESGKSMERPGLQRALALLRDGAVDALLVMKLDRLTRSVRDLGALVDDFFAGDRAALLSVSEQIDTRSAAGRLVLNVLASVAQWERETICERTSTVLQHMKAEGRRVGSVPYGYRLKDDGLHLEAVPAEQAVIDEARELRAAGLSLRKIAGELEKRGRRSRKGRPFASEQVRRMLAA